MSRKELQIILRRLRKAELSINNSYLRLKVLNYENKYFAEMPLPFNSLMYVCMHVWIYSLKQDTFMIENNNI